MKHYSIHNFKHILTRLSAVLLVIVLLLPACTRQSQAVKVEEITFRSGEFTLVGDF